MNMNVMFSSDDMTWATPQSFFNQLNDEFHFTLDPCCGHNTAKCEKYYTKDMDGLSKSWENQIVFMNPPYGREIYEWIEKAYNESVYNNAIVVCLIPARTDTKYWHDFCMKASEIRFVKGRLKFGNSDNSAPFPSAVIIFRPNDNNVKVIPMIQYNNYISEYPIYTPILSSVYPTLAEPAMIIPATIIKKE